jgi:peptide/nickel transport system permease protein
MLIFILKRVGLGLITLWILSVLVFFASQVLPGDPARAILGPLAAPSAVAALSHQLGTDKPLLTQYWHWISHFVTGNPGISYQYQAPIGPLLTKALGNSLKLAAVAFVMVVPLGILGGVVAALNVGRPIDRIISVFGLSATVIPEVVSGIVLILIFGIALNVLPISATAPPGAGIGTQIYHLIMPAIPLTLILFGYIQQMARAGTVEALASDYARTATLKGLPRGVMIRRHILRNSLLPTITVIATQTGYLIGGLVLVETLFHYQGIGSLIYNAATSKDFPMLEAGVLVIGIVYMVATLVADIIYSLLNPRIRHRGVE